MGEKVVAEAGDWLQTAAPIQEVNLLETMGAVNGGH